MGDVQFILSLIIPILSQGTFYFISHYKSNVSQLPEDIRNKVMLNPRDLNKVDREVLFSCLKIKPISNEIMYFISKNSEKPLHSIIWFSKLENKYVNFIDNEIVFVGKMCFKDNINFTKKFFEILYYLVAFVSIYPHLNDITNIFSTTNLLSIVVSSFGLLVALLCANHSISIDMAEELITTLKNQANENEQNDLLSV